VEIREIIDKDFGKIVMVSNDTVELGVAVDFGPRIIHFALAGQDNVLYQDRDKKPIGEQLASYDDVFRLYGGHRLWISPEVLPRCYHPDNEPVKWEDVSIGMKFTAAVEKFNGIEKSMLITLADNSAKICHEIRNCGAWDIELAPWAITMLAPGGTANIAMTKKGTGLLPNRQIVFWDYTNTQDARIAIGRDFITVKQNKKSDTALKVGLFNDDLEAGISYALNGQTFHKYAEAPTGVYPDMGCNYEVYANADFLEAESLGPMTKLAPNETVCHDEYWEITSEE